MILCGILDCSLDCFDWGPAKIGFDLFIVIWSCLYRPWLHRGTNVMDIFWMDIEISEIVGIALVAHSYGGGIKIEVFSPVFMVKDLNLIVSVAIWFSK